MGALLKRVQNKTHNITRMEEEEAGVGVATVAGDQEGSLEQETTVLKP